MSEDSPPLTTSSSSPSAKQSFAQSQTSFVYPVRSLLTAIKPAAPTPRGRSTNRIPSSTTRKSQSHDLLHSRLRQEAGSADTNEDGPMRLRGGRNRSRGPTTLSFPDQSSCDLVQAAEQPSNASGSPRPRRTTLSISRVSSESSLQSITASYHIPPASPHSASDFTTSDSNGKRKRAKTTFRFHHLPADEKDPNNRRTFSTADPSKSVGQTSEPENQNKELECVPMPLPLVASSALIATSVSLLPSATSPPMPMPPSVSPPEKSPVFAASVEGQEQSSHSRDFTNETVHSPDRTQEQAPSDDHTDSPVPSVERWHTPETSFSFEVDPPAESPKRSGDSENIPFSGVADEVPDLPFNPSLYGLVHLPPLPSPGSSEQWSGSRVSSTQQSLYTRSGRAHGTESTSSDRSLAGGSDGSSKYYSASPKVIAAATSVATSSTGSNDVASGEGGYDRTSPIGSSSGSWRAASSAPSEVESRADAASRSEFSSGSEEYVNFRFQYATDEHGNYIVVGREGKMQRCEDEPIRTPGAVQGFGVLIVVEDLEETLVVRQVSENSTELLGLSPRYLFSLECFTDALPENSAGTLWDNIQFLTDSTYPASEDEDNAPHVFVLNGWGEPGSAPALSDPHEGSPAPSQPETRRHWTCWCAVHKARTVHDGRPTLIMLEFELESDAFNPLYPPTPAFNLNPPANNWQGLSSSSTLVSSPGASSTGSTAVSDISCPSAAGTPSKESNTSSDTPSANAPPSSTPHPPAWSQFTPHPLSGLEGQDDWTPSAEDILESTTNYAKPLPALERLRRLTQRGPSPYGPSSLTSSRSASSNNPIPSMRSTSPKTTRTRRRGAASASAVGMMDVFAVMAQINEQLGAAQDLSKFLKVTVGLLKDLTQFHRVLTYQFDEAWNGQVVAELVDWGVTRDLYRGLHFPAADIPKQARDLYVTNKVRVLYDRLQPTARMVARDKSDLEEPLDMTHCYLRAMSPIHLKYLENMGVRASMSVSIMAFNQLWGLIACHSYGNAGMRVSFPVRQMLRLLTQSISRNIERLSYAQRLHTRKLINTLSSGRHSTGYIVSNADDLLGLFDADFGILVIGEGAKILGPNQHGQEILIMAEYLRLKQFNTIQVSQAVINDFPDLQLTTGLEVIAGLLYVPLSSEGKDFMAFLRRGQLRNVHWAGKPFKSASHDAQAGLEPRKSFKIWSETVAGRSRAWTDEQLETAGVLSLVYGKFIEVWRQKQSALQMTKLTNLLLSNATHEVRTPLNHIINYLEMAMNGPLDNETRDNLVRSHAASKSLLFTINDLLDLTRLESGNETSFSEPFDLHAAIKDAVRIYQREALRRNLEFVLDVSGSPKTVVGDPRKIRTVVQNLTANALKYTEAGSISVSCKTFGEPEGLRSPKQAAVEIIVADTGCGIQEEKLEKMFREFEQVESSEPRSNAEAGVGLGLAVVARIVEQLGGQLRVDSKVDVGSRFSSLIPLALTLEGSDLPAFSESSGSSSASSQACSRPPSLLPRRNVVDRLAETLSSNCITSRSSSPREKSTPAPEAGPPPRTPSRGIDVKGSGVPPRPFKVDHYDQEVVRTTKAPQTFLDDPPATTIESDQISPPRSPNTEPKTVKPEKLRILVVEDNDVNRTILAKRLSMNGHIVVGATNGQEGIDTVKSDDGFDIVLMDIQMPIVDGFEATQRIRAMEGDPTSPIGVRSSNRPSHKLNGRIPILAVSASLREQQRNELINYGLDGWVLKPIDFKRLNVILKGVTDIEQRKRDVYRVGGDWEIGGWLENRTGRDGKSYRTDSSKVLLHI